MTGPEHYRTAEEYLQYAKVAPATAELKDIVTMLRFAELHVRLAGVAAIIDAHRYDEATESFKADDWQEVLS